MVTKTGVLVEVYYANLPVPGAVTDTHFSTGKRKDDFHGDTLVPMMVSCLRPYLHVFD